MAINLWAHENLKQLIKSCQGSLVEHGLEKLFSDYHAVREERKRLDRIEGNLFKAILVKFSQKEPGATLEITEGNWVGKVERKLNTKVDHKEVEKLLKSETLSPETNFGVTPFRVKFEVDKKEMAGLREREPEYYLHVIAPLLEIASGKPGLKVSFQGMENPGGAL